MKEKLLKIIVRVPASKDGIWKISVISNGLGGRPFKKSSAVSSYRFLEKKLVPYLTSQVKAKINVSVDYGHGYANESEDANDVNEILYSTACFLEDYLPSKFLAARYKKYGISV